MAACPIELRISKIGNVVTLKLQNVSQKKSQELMFSYLSKYMNPEPYDWKLSCNVAVDWDSVMIFLCVGVTASKHSKHMVPCIAKHC